MFLLAAIFSYRGARAAARRYAEYISTAYDLHRFDMLAAMHQKLPETMEQELGENAELSAFLSGGVPMTAMGQPGEMAQRRYDHPQPLTVLIASAGAASGGATGQAGGDGGGTGGDGEADESRS